MSKTEATIFVIDDDAEVRGGLTLLLRSAGWPVQAFATAQQFLDQLPLRGAGCILLDVMMPGMSGPELHQRMKELGLRTPVIYLTGQGSVPMGVQAMKRGAKDFLEKPIDADLLLDAIDQAVAQNLQDRSEQSHLAELRERLNSLWVREREVMVHVIAGRLNKQIADDLGIAEKTVKVHRYRVMRKAGVRSVAQLVRICDELGIVPPSSGNSADHR